MYSAKSFQLTKDEFNYLLPVMVDKLHKSGDICYFTSYNIDDLTDMLNVYYIYKKPFKYFITG